jgi:hypothetical protein
MGNNRRNAMQYSEWTNEEAAGMLPEILRPDDPRPVKEQLNDRYSHGGGFMASKGFTFKKEGDKAILSYEIEDDDPEIYQEWSRSKVNDEELYLFDASFMAIVQPDGTYEVTRVD